MKFRYKNWQKSKTPTKIFLQFLERNWQDMQGYAEAVYEFE